MPSSAWRSTLFPYTTLFRSDRKSTRLNSSHDQISYAVFCLKKKKEKHQECITFTKRAECETLLFKCGTGIGRLLTRNGRPGCEPRIVAWGRQRSVGDSTVE